MVAEQRKINAQQSELLRTCSKKRPNKLTRDVQGYKGGSAEKEYMEDAVVTFITRAEF